jgi:hypothetical protein
MANEKEFPLDALFCNNIKGEEPKLEVVKIPSVDTKQKTDQILILGEPMKKPVFTIKDLTPEVRQYMMNLVLAVSLASGLPTPAQADVGKFDHAGVMKKCDKNGDSKIQKGFEKTCYLGFRKEYTDSLMTPFEIQLRDGAKNNPNHIDNLTLEQLEERIKIIEEEKRQREANIAKQNENIARLDAEGNRLDAEGNRLDANINLARKLNKKYSGGLPTYYKKD